MISYKQLNIMTKTTKWPARTAEASDRTRRMARLVGVFAGCTLHIADFLMLWLHYIFITPKNEKLIVFWILILIIIAILIQIRSVNFCAM